MVVHSPFLARAVLLALSIMAAFVFSHMAHADQVTAALDKNVVSENEVVKLTIRTDFTNTGNGPDLSALKRDFDILSRSQNSQFSFNLGTNQALNFWVINLMPKAVGNFEIPPIQVGDKTSEPLYLEVKAAQQMRDQNGNPLVMLKFSASTLEPYVQQQVLLTLDLYTAVTLQNPSLSIPNHPTLLTERLTDEQMRYEDIEGTSYQVITHEFVAFPQRSGALELSNQSIEALVNTRSGARKVTVKSPPITLNVLPIPASYGNSNWLPTEAVTARSNLSSTVDKPRIGDTLIWEIDITAQGVLAEQLPTLNFASTRTYKLYPTSPSYNTNKSIAGVSGHEAMRIEVVPTQSGPLELPTVEVTYWDPLARTLKIAQAKAPTIDIAALPTTTTNDSSDTPVTPVTPAPSSSLPPQPTSVAPISLAKSNANAAPSTTQETSEQTADLNVVITPKGTDTRSWQGYIALLLIISGAMGLGAWLWMRRKHATDKNQKYDVPTLEEFAPLSSGDENTAYQQLLHSCRTNDLSTLRLNLLEWARHRWGDDAIRGVDDIKRLCNSALLIQLLMEAELIMYSSSASPQWRGDALAEALEEYVTGQPKPSQASQLKTLYPNF